MTINPESRSGFSTDQTTVDPEGRPIAVRPAGAPVAPVVQQVVPATEVRQNATTYGRRYAFDSVIVGLVGVAWLIIGLIAMIRAGFDGSMEEPVVEVMGFTHTATLGIIEAGIGLCLLLCAAALTRGGSVFFGVLLVVGGIVGAVQSESFDRSLALESGLAWLAVISGVIVVLVRLLVPRMVTRTDRVESV